MMMMMSNKYKEYHNNKIEVATNIDDISSETGELIVASPKPRLSGYFRPGLKSTLSQSKSRSSRYSAGGGGAAGGFKQLNNGSTTPFNATGSKNDMS